MNPLLFSNDALISDHGDTPSRASAYGGCGHPASPFSRHYDRARGSWVRREPAWTNSVFVEPVANKIRVKPFAEHEYRVFEVTGWGDSWGK